MCTTIYSDTASNFPNVPATFGPEVFDSLAERPMHMLTRSEWQRQGRKVVNRSKPVATAKVSYRFDPVGLFEYGQTKPYHPTPRTKALDDYWSTFVKDHNKGAFIWWSEKDGGWRTVGDEEVPYHLNRRNVRQHLRGKEVFGVRGGSKTCFGSIDLDLHAGDKGIFMEMFRVLLSALHGRENWHFSLSAGGVHIINIFPKMTLDLWRYRMRKSLRMLDHQHPELVEQAQRQGMKTFGELELYPCEERGFRLPLARDRLVLIDKPLANVQYRGAAERDVQGYMTWLCRENKQFMPIEDVLRLVKDTVRERPGRGKHDTTDDRVHESERSIYIRSLSGTPSPSKCLKGRFASELIAFWTGKDSVITDVHRAIILTTRLLPYEVGKDEAVSLLHDYVSALPRLNSKSASDPKRLDAGIRARIEKVYSSNGWQKDVTQSNMKLAKTAEAWHRRGFYISRKDTWVNYRTSPVEFTEQETALIRWHFPDVLKCDGDTAIKAVKHFLSFVDLFGGNGIPRNAIPTILKQFAIKWGKNRKISDFIKKLVALDWIVHGPHRWVSRGKKGKGQARRYGIGPAIMHHFSKACEAECA